MSLNPERAALLASILADPSHDLPKLVMADWMEERGNESDCIHARFIRRQFAGPPRNVPLTVLTELEPFIGCQPHQYGFNVSPAAGVAEVGYRNGMSFIYRKGFVSEIRLPLALFLDHARDLFSRHPLEHVVLTDRGPDDLGYGWGWYQGPYDASGDYVPEGIARHFQPLPSHWVWPTEAEAQAALSAAAVAYGRELANLPPLEAVK